MRRSEPQVASSPTPGPAAVRAARPRRFPKAWVAALAAVAALGASALATVASAERDAFLRTHPQVPDLVGKPIAEAARMMTPLHFGILVTGARPDPIASAGVILSQNPPPGRLIAIGSVIQVKVSQGSGAVPRLRGMPVQEAARRLERVGLRLGQVHGIADDAPPGIVLEQFTPPGHALNANSPVNVLISNGPEGAASGPASPSLLDGAPAVAGPPAAAPPTVLLPGRRPLAAPSVDGVSSTPPVLTPRPAEPTRDDRRQEGGTRARSAPDDCSADPQRERAQVCRQPADDRGTEPDLHGREHRAVPSGP